MPEEDEIGSSPAALAGLLITTPGKGSDADAAAAKDEQTTPPTDDDGDESDDWNSQGEQSDPADEAEEGDDGEDDGSDDAEKGPDTEPRYTVKIDGKDTVVTLSEALAGYQRGQDYTRKTQEIAESRKAIDTELAAAREAREQYAGHLKVLSERIGAEADEPTPDQWNALKASDPERYATEYVDYQRRQEARTKIKAEQDRLEGERQTEAKKVFGEIVNKQRDALLEKMPEWKDAKKYEAGAKAIFAHAKEAYNFNDAELSQVYDHRMLLMAEDARKYRALVAQKAKAKVKLDNAPTVPPRARAAQQDARQTAKAEAEKRFKRSGRVDDALPLMFK